ncbi:magnesium transporter [Ochrobactrum sp. 30A/1000/2015]|nr:magnesium transporter [Ochrobactrum sp. 30A/1000/2015]PJT39517.1 magnesium transporter [Ochrobactrum sp. 27A/999/2015]PJT43811.1 magnesium transporter [Ochrobactrum sp. 23A/997/2015]
MQTTTNELRSLFLEGPKVEINTALAAHHPADLAAALQGLEPASAWDTLQQADRPRQADVFGYLNHDFQTLLATVTPRADLAAIVMEMNADDRADLYKELSPEQRDALMPALAQAEREDIRRLAAYEEGTAGAIMTSDYAALSPELSATKALTVLRHEAPDKETIYRAYVIDEDRALLGSVRLQDLITAPAHARVAGVMETNTHAIHVDDDVEDAARKIAHYDVIALPVVDHDGKLVGIITHDDALDVMEAEATEDFHRVGTVTNLESGVSTASVPMLYRARIVWLMLLVFGNIFSGAGIAHFEDTIAAHLALMFFLPILIASGGNAGSQSATLMVRALATGEIGMSDWGRVLGRELVVAVLLGLSMAAAIAIIGVVRGGPEITLVIALSMILIVIVGSLIGMILPFLLSRFNMDPATASTPVVTSIADATGVLIYFSIAKSILAMP